MEFLYHLTVAVLLVDRLLDIVAISRSSNGDVNRQSSTRSTAPMLSHDAEANKLEGSQAVDEQASHYSFDRE